MTIACPPPTSLKATQDPRANAGRMRTPRAVTWRSRRGKLKRTTSPGCVAPFRPSACSTALQLPVPRGAFCAVAIVALNTTRARALQIAT